jgi:glycosyltransferase involved in cell wall biosynthesis
MSRLQISVAMCTYNGSRYLQEQLQSIASQTRLPDELVVCDDGSTDDTVSLLTAFAAQAPFPIRMYSNERRLGPTKNFERAIRLCRGDVISLCDQDDTWKPLKLEKLVAILDEHPRAGYVFSDAEIMDETGAALKGSLWEWIRFDKALLKRFADGDQVSILLKFNLVCGATLTFRSTLNSIILPIPDQWIHDHWIASLGSSFAYGVPVQERLIRYRRHGMQQVGLQNHSRSKEWMESLKTAGEQHVRRHEGFGELQRRVLLGAATSQCPPIVTRTIQEKVTHLANRRANQSLTGVAKIRAVLTEALSGRYQRFSNSWWSILRDLCPRAILKC